MINDVIDILESQAKIYGKLIKYSEQMQVAIIKDEVNELNILIQAESALAMKFSVLEKKRVKLVKRLAASLEFSGENFNIVEMKKHATGEQVEKLTKLEEKMAKIVIKLNSINSTNGRLIKNRLDIVNFSLNYLGLSNNGVYDKKSKNKTTQSKLIDESI
jgi:flagellar biosynthesis/type III secretory pathway chaperone